MVVHDEDRQEAVRVLDARISHLDEYVGILLEIDHEFLLLLHVPEFVFIHAVRVMEEQVVLTRQLNFDLVDLPLNCSVLMHEKQVRFKHFCDKSRIYLRAVAL